MTDDYAFAKFMRKFWAKEPLFPQPDSVRERTRERYALRVAFDAGREYEREKGDGDE